MTTKNVTRKEVTTIIANGVNELKEVVNNPFYYSNELNRLSRKNEFCDGKNVAAIGALVRTLHENKRYAFDLCIFPKDSAGRFCVPCTLNIMRRSIHTIDGLEVVNIDEDTHTAYYLRPVRLSLAGMLRDFSLMAKRSIFADLKERAAAERAEKKAAKVAEREAKKAQKSKEAKRLVLVKRYNNGEIDIEALQAELAKIA